MRDVRWCRLFLREWKEWCLNLHSSLLQHTLGLVQQGARAVCLAMSFDKRGRVSWPDLVLARLTMPITSSVSVARVSMGEKKATNIFAAVYYEQ